MTAHSSEVLLRQFRDGDSASARLIFDRYVRRLIALARSRIGPRLRPRVDPEDVVQSAYRSFFVRARNNQFTLRGAGDLWRLLANITLHKLYGQVEVHTAARRNVERESRPSCNLDAIAVAPEPTADEAVAIVEELQLVMERLTPLERTALIARLQGRTIEEIASSLRRSPRTVRRMLALAEQHIEGRLLDDSARVMPRRNRLGNQQPNSKDSARPSVIAPDRRAPLRFADYLLEEMLGSGGMGKVYRATHRPTGRCVAVKALLKSRQADSQAVESFVQESQVLVGVVHPHIIRLEGLGQFPSGGYFLVMEYVSGGDLQQRLEHKPLDVKLAVQFVVQVADAVGYLHERGVVHCDLKPGNVLLGERDRTVVTDFGFAQLLSHRVATSRRTIGGTVGYMAPEVRQFGESPTIAADIYGLGALLYALVLGAPPDDADSIRQLSKAPPGLRRILRKCLSRDPRRRYATAAELVRDLRATEGIA